MKAANLSILVLAFFVAVACGGPAEEASEAAQPAAEPEAAAEPAAEEGGAMTPADLGDKVGELYVASLTELAGLMADRPAAADLGPQVEALKETYVAKFVALGKEKAGLSDADKATVNSRVRTAMRGVPSDVFTAFSEGQMHYQKAGDTELAQMIGDFNVITQYADFELLKKQAPAEAERLGIE